MSRKIKLREGEEIQIGDYVGFKSDVEQYAKVVAYDGYSLKLEAPEDGFSGSYINGQDYTWQDKDSCWVD